MSELKNSTLAPTSPKRCAFRLNTPQPKRITSKLQSQKPLRKTNQPRLHRNNKDALHLTFLIWPKKSKHWVLCLWTHLIRRTKNSKTQKCKIPKLPLNMKQWAHSRPASPKPSSKSLLTLFQTLQVWQILTWLATLD